MACPSKSAAVLTFTHESTARHAASTMRGTKRGWSLFMGEDGEWLLTSSRISEGALLRAGFERVAIL